MTLTFNPEKYTALPLVIIYQLAKYEKDLMKSQNADSGKEKKKKKRNKKEKTIQQQKGLPTMSADLKNVHFLKQWHGGL